MRFVEPKIVDKYDFESNFKDINPRLIPADGISTPEGKVIGPALTSVIGIGSGRWFVLARSIAGRHGLSANNFGFRYPTDELDRDEEPFKGVRLFAFDEDVFVEVPVFDALMLRFFKKAIECAEERDDEALHSEWWPEFLECVSQIRTASPS